MLGLPQVHNTCLPTENRKEEEKLLFPLCFNIKAGKKILICNQRLGGNVNTSFFWNEHKIPPKIKLLSEKAATIKSTLTHVSSSVFDESEKKK